MNRTIETFARERIREGLHSLPVECQTRFKLMYCEPLDDQARTPNVVAAIKAANLDDVIDGIPQKKLDTVLSQVERTIVERKKKLVSR